MTDTTKTEALRLADAIDKGDYSMRDLKAIAAELRRLDKIEGFADEQQDQLHRQAIRLSTVESERDRLAAECEALRAAAELAIDALKSCDWCGSAGLEVQCFDEDKVWAAIAAITAAMGGKE